MSAGNSFNLSSEAAKGYETQKVPAIFAPIAKATLEQTELPENAAVIDIACGTGIVSRLLVEYLSGKGRIVGTDLNPAMLEIAKELMPETHHGVEWFECDVSNLPFEDATFDAAFCQQGLQFFPEKPEALAEIRRVITPGGRLMLTCWRSVSPVFQVVSNSLKNRVSETAAIQAVRPYAFRDGEIIAALLTGAGFSNVEVSKIVVDRHFSPSRAAIRAEILSSPYEGELRAKGDKVIDAVVEDVDAELERYRVGDGLIVPQDTHLFKATA